MPFKSARQSRYAFANPAKFGGVEKVMEWAHATNYGNLPEKAHSKSSLPAPTRRKKMVRK